MTESPFHIPTSFFRWVIADDLAATLAGLGAQSPSRPGRIRGLCGEMQLIPGPPRLAVAATLAVSEGQIKHATLRTSDPEYAARPALAAAIACDGGVSPRMLENVAAIIAADGGREQMADILVFPEGAVVIGDAFHDALKRLTPGAVAQKDIDALPLRLAIAHAPGRSAHARLALRTRLARHKQLMDFFIGPVATDGAERFLRLPDL